MCGEAELWSKLLEQGFSVVPDRDDDWDRIKMFLALIWLTFSSAGIVRMS
jgi:hypothetical protein